MTAYGLQALSLNGSALVGVRGNVLQRQNKIDSDGADGTMSETYHTMLQRASVATWDTIAAKVMLTACGASSLTVPIPFAALNGTTGAVLAYALANNQGPGYAAGSVHETRTALNGVAVMESFKWTLGSFATMGMKLYPISLNGTSDPLTQTDTAALPAQSFNQQGYTLTGLTLDGVSVINCNSLSLNVDHKFDFDWLLGCPYPTAVTGGGPKGRIGIRLEAEVRDVSVPEGVGAVSAVFTAAAQGGTLGSSTITWTLNAGWTLEDSVQSPLSSPSSKKLIIRPVADSTHSALSWAVT